MRKEELTSREKRRRRRIKSQVIAYGALGLFIILVGAGIFYGIRTTIKGIESYNQEVSNALAEAESNVARESESMELSSESVAQDELTEEMIQQEQVTENAPLSALLEGADSKMRECCFQGVVAPPGFTDVGRHKTSSAPAHSFLQTSLSGLAGHVWETDKGGQR